MEIQRNKPYGSLFLCIFFGLNDYYPADCRDYLAGFPADEPGCSDHFGYFGYFGYFDRVPVRLFVLLLMPSAGRWQSLPDYFPCPATVRPWMRFLAACLGPLRRTRGYLYPPDFDFDYYCYLPW